MAVSVPPAHAPAEQRKLPRDAAPASSWAFPSWPITALSVPILLRASILVVALAVEPWSSDPQRIVPAWAQILQAFCFASLAFVLLHYGRHDLRARVLGLFVLDAAATLLTPFVRGIDDPSPLTWLGLRLRTDAFQAAMLWCFAGVFPRSSARESVARAFHAGAAAAFLLGALLVAFDAFAAIAAGAPSGFWVDLARALQRESPRDTDWYFGAQFLLLAPLPVLMALKLREVGPGDRRRFLLLVVGLVVGFLPLAADVLLMALWPWYATASSGGRALRVKGAIIVCALTLVPLAGAYAALVQRALDVSFMLRRAVQYVLARSFIRTVAALPLVALVLLVVFNRDRSIAELVSGTVGVMLAVLAAMGVAAAAGRDHLLAALDRRFFRHHVDTKETLLGVAEALRRTRSVDDLRAALAAAIEGALHPETFVMAVAGDDDCLHTIDADLPALSKGSALVQLLSADDLPLVVRGSSSSIVDRLSARERDWLTAAGAVVLMPLRGSADDVLGIVALGEKQSELPYSPEELSVLAAVGSPAGLALARILDATRERRGQVTPALADPPARECIECGAVLDANAVACTCGGTVQRARVPLELADRLRFVKRLGAGAMGIVYQATDLRLQQPRAVKTLPHADPVLLAKMRREARHMAAVVHPNLATIHGFEWWQGGPMLVMEYLGGGTLAGRLRGGPLAASESGAICIALARALASLHTRGVLHRDVKPSNIGFTGDGTPKLLDFGLATLLPKTPAAEGSTWEAPDRTGSGGIRGTPAYMSPEVLGGAAPSPADDLWGLSVVLIESLTGENPFRAQTAAATVARVLTEPHCVAAAAERLAPPLRLLFAELLGPRDARPRGADHFADRVQHCFPQGG